ncbi:MAG: WalW protein [Planctomycetaceae bacterium]|nr:WalW protein [Planctomycetaceae bacterium]
MSLPVEQPARPAFPCEGRAPVHWPEDWRPTLVTAISTEEEFDWSGPFDPRQRSVEAAKHLERGQRVFDDSGVRPTYIVDHPIATDPISIASLGAIHASGRCEIGAHLHPWVNPPFEDPPGVRHSFPGNLPGELEHHKLRQLAHAIQASFGVRPCSYQAGRYGFGPNTARLLEEEGFSVDLSASPAFDYSGEGGPDYSDFSPEPFWFGRERKLLALPVTGGYLGFLSRSGPNLHRLSQSPPLRSLRVPGVLARTRALERVRLSPEGFDLATLERLTESLLDRGARVFVLGLHSPSFLPGCTPYVRNERELDEFLDRLARYYRFFHSSVGGRSMTAAEVHRSLAPTKLS